VTAVKKTPKRKKPRGHTPTHSIRFSDEEWADIEAKARRLGLTASAAIRQQALSWARSP
jgi:hypothetical protein